MSNYNSLIKMKLLRHSSRVHALLSRGHGFESHKVLGLGMEGLDTLAYPANLILPNFLRGHPQLHFMSFWGTRVTNGLRKSHLLRTPYHGSEGHQELEVHGEHAAKVGLESVGEITDNQQLVLNSSTFQLVDSSRGHSSSVSRAS